MAARRKISREATAVVDREWRRLWQRLAELNGDLVSVYPSLEDQGRYTEEVRAALTQVLETMNQADSALTELRSVLARRLH